MKVLGITGGVGMGKSAADQHLRGRGIPVIDTDQLARELVQPGQVALHEIVSAFGPDMVGSNGQLRRDLMAARVFGDPQARQTLERILHPRIRTLWLEQVARLRDEGGTISCVVIPLLYEAGADKDVDSVLCVACTRRSQRMRLRQRGWTDPQIDQRIEAQWPIERKMYAAQFVAWSEGGLNILHAQLDVVLTSF